MICRTCRGSRSSEEEVLATQFAYQDAETASVELVRQRLCPRWFDFLPNVGAHGGCCEFVISRPFRGDPTRHRCLLNPQRGEHVTDGLMHVADFRSSDVEMITSLPCGARKPCSYSQSSWTGRSICLAAPARNAANISSASFLSHHEEERTRRSSFLAKHVASKILQ